MIARQRFRKLATREHRVNASGISEIPRKPKSRRTASTACIGDEFVSLETHDPIFAAEYVE